MQANALKNFEIKSWLDLGLGHRHQYNQDFLLAFYSASSRCLLGVYEARLRLKNFENSLFWKLGYTTSSHLDTCKFTWEYSVFNKGCICE